MACARDMHNHRCGLNALTLGVAFSLISVFPFSLLAAANDFFIISNFLYYYYDYT